MYSGAYEDRRDEAVRRSGVLGRSGDDELASVVAFAAARYKTTFAALSIVTGRRQILLHPVGLSMRETPRDEAFCAVAIQRPGEPLIVNDAARDSRFAHLPIVTGAPFVRFYAGVPVVDQNGYALGALCIGDPTPHHAPFDPTDLMIRAREIEGILRW